MGNSDLAQDPIQGFKSRMESLGIGPPDIIHADGKVHRFSTSGKRSDDAGWYVFHLDGIPAGVFGCWRSGMAETWCAKPENVMSPAERAAHRLRIEAIQAERKTAETQKRESAALAAAKRWNAAVACIEHPYLAAKGVPSFGLRTDQSGDLLVPVRDSSGALHSLQSITATGDKLFMPGGRTKGCFHNIGELSETPLIVCEGYATGASLREATGHTVVIAFNAGNLLAVTQELRAKLPETVIIVAADDDRCTTGNPGLTKAKAAAERVGGRVVAPDFGTNPPDGATDFNDLHQQAGLAAVKRCVEAVTAKWSAWPDPTPLPDPLPPVQAFDAALLPNALRPWVMDIAHRMQCPPDFPAVAVLVAASSLIGARAVVQPKARDDWQVVPNQWGMAIGRPGVKKSPALGEALRPLNRLQQAELKRTQFERESWALDCKVAELAGDANTKKAKALAGRDPAAARALLEPTDLPTEPVARRFIVNDATVEKLGELLQQNPWGTLSYRDELYGLLVGLDKPGQEGSRAFYLQAYDGNQGYTFDRIMRGTVHIPRVCLAMIGGIQPGRIQEYVRGAVAGGSGDDGLLQRFGLTVWPDIKGEYVHVDQWPDTPAKQAAWAVFERLATLEPASEDEPHVWRFDPAAQALFVEWLVPFETELRGDELHPAMISHLSKYRKLIPALALVFALIDTPDNDLIIGEQELLRALAWSDYLRTHAGRLYAAAIVPETAAATNLLSKIKAGKLIDRDGVLMDMFTPRQVAQKGWAGLTTPDAVRKAADVLVDFDWLKPDTALISATGGRPSDRYLMNPAALSWSSPA